MIFSLNRIDSEFIVLNVNVSDPIEVALHPYVGINYKYITIPKGKGDDPYITIIMDSGKSFSYCRATLVSDNLKTLYKKVMEFLKEQGITKLSAPITESTIFYNSNFNKWELKLQSRNSNRTETEYLFFDDCKSEKDVIEKAKKFGISKKWKHGIAETGIDIWS